jgi:hypothetical protein
MGLPPPPLLPLGGPPDWPLEELDWLLLELLC